MLLKCEVRGPLMLFHGAVILMNGRSIRPYTGRQSLTNKGMALEFWLAPGLSLTFMCWKAGLSALYHCLIIMGNQHWWSLTFLDGPPQFEVICVCQFPLLLVENNFFLLLLLLLLILLLVLFLLLLLLLPHERAITLLLWHQHVGERRSLSSEICAQCDPPTFEKRRLRQISAHNVSTVRDSEKS